MRSLFLASTSYPKEEKQKLYKISIDTLWKNIKKRRFFYIVREENIWPQVLGDRIYPKNCIKIKNVNVQLSFLIGNISAAGKGHTHLFIHLTTQKKKNRNYTKYL
jgi:hypothetical protein